MEKPSWHFLESGSGIVSASNLANPLKDTNLNDFEILVREAFQNSYDERISDESFKFKIKKHIIKQNKVKKFLDLLNLKKILEQSKYFDDTNNYIKNGMNILKDCLENNCDLPILEISDFNSNGLGGRWNKGRHIDDRFFNLVLSISRSRKQDNSDGENYLGSYGVGKMVFALSSEIRSILYYSKFKPSEVSNNDNTRLMMTSFLPLIYNEEDDIEFSGHAYFGIESGENNNPRKPIINNAADEFITSLGFKPRKDNDYGTSVFLPFCDFDIQQIKSSIEKWWWPALTGNPNILIELEDENGYIFKPNPLQNDFSRPFVEIFKKDTEKLRIIHDSKRKELGDFRLEKLNENEDISVANKVACIRGGLVIDYKNPFREDEENCIGIVKINKNYEKYFTFSEPEAHDKWNPNHGRLFNKFGPSGKKLVEQGLNQIDIKSRDFQMSLKKIDKNKSYSGTKFLDDRLSQIFKSLKRGKPNSPPTTSRLPYIHKSSKRVLNNGTALDHLYFTVGLNDDIEVENIDYQLKITLMSVVDANNSRGEIIPIEVSIDEEKDKNVKSNSIINFSLNNSTVVKGEAKGKVFSKWTTKWIIELIPMDI